MGGAMRARNRNVAWIGGVLLLPALLTGCASVPPPPSVACDALDPELASRELKPVGIHRSGTRKYQLRGVAGERIRLTVEPVQPKEVALNVRGANGLPYTGESSVVNCIGGEPRASIDLELPKQDEGIYTVWVWTGVPPEQPVFQLERVTFGASQSDGAPSAPTPIYGNTGQYMSPFTEDGTVAPWVEKGMTATISGNVGSSFGAYAGQQVLENVPMVGSVLGATVGRTIGREIALRGAGGWEFIKESSDLSFDSLDDMARYLVATNASHPQFAKVLTATYGIYPELEQSIAAAIRERSQIMANAKRSK